MNIHTIRTAIIGTALFASLAVTSSAGADPQPVDDRLDVLEKAAAPAPPSSGPVEEEGTKSGGTGGTITVTCFGAQCTGTVAECTRFCKLLSM